MSMDAANDSEPKPLLDISTLERECQELKTLNSALARDHGQLHAHFMALATDFKELAAEYQELYAEYDTLVEEHESLATKHEALATKYETLAGQHQRLRSQHARTVTRCPGQTSVNPGPSPAQRAMLTSAIQPVLTMMVADVPERCHRTT
ncbi:hypothetical protein K438DRAFT_1954124 [Mycena galopus ATCC 62051]|nr:hypothetical protein K438DRAFT_1954124 [Mycena galopus ATCC 62051]